MRVLFTAAFSLILLAGCSEEARESHQPSSGEKGFNFGIDVDHKLSPEQIGTSFDYFDSQYEIAKKGGDVDCEGLMSKVVRLKHGRHMAESHGEFTQDVDVMDYMALTSNNFIDIGVCVSEIEQKRISMCGEAADIVADVEKKNAMLSEEERDGGFSYGYSVSHAVKMFCDI